MAAKGGDNASDEIIETKCSVCAGKNITREAEKYCVECQDYYCIPCSDMHKAFPALREHKLMDKADFSTHGLRSSLPSFPTERCPIHKAKLLDMFCKNHDEVVCATCVAINHRTCRDIHSIPDEVDNLYKQSASDQTQKQLLAAKKALDDEKKAKQQILTELKKQKQTATDSIINYRKELEAELKILETESIKEVDAQYSSMERDLQSEIKEAEKHIDDLEQSATKLRKSNGNKAQEFVCVKTAQKKILTPKSSPSKIQTEVKIFFSAKMKIKNYLKQLKTLGQVSTADATDKPRTTAYKVKQQMDIDITLKEDNKVSSGIFGSCFTEDGSLLLADVGNSKLKRLDVSTHTIIDHLHLAAVPNAVCLTRKQEAAVSLRNNTIQFVSLGDKMTTTRELKMDHYCYGLAFIDGKFFISDSSKTVYIHDKSGTMLHKITTDKSGSPIFLKNRHISVSTNRDCVYVADTTGVISLDMQGNYVPTFTDPDLVWSQGVCTDKRGNILVCGWKSSDIVQINEDSKTKLGSIKTYAYPLSVCFDPQQNKLAVTHEYSNTVTVYELE